MVDCFVDWLMVVAGVGGGGGGGSCSILHGT